MLYAYGGGFLAQGLYFLVLARELGATGLGIFAGALGIVSIVAPFAGLGSGNLLFMRVSRDQTLYGAQLAFALRWLGCSALLIGGALELVSVTALKHSPLGHVMLPLIISEVLMARLIELCALGYQASGLVRNAAHVTISISVLRVVAVLAFAAEGDRSTLTWCWCYCACTAVVAFAICCATLHKLGLPKDARWTVRDLKVSIPFAIGQASKTVYTDIDKAMLAGFSSPATAGVYAAAYRLISFAFTPIQALVFSSGPRFFRAGQEGSAMVWRIALRMAPLVLTYAVVACIASEIASPIIPLVLGHGYAQSAGALRSLAPLLVVQAVHYLFGDALMGAGRQGARSVLQIGTAILNVVLNLWLIPQYAIRGAAVSTLVGEGLLALVTIFLLKRLAQRGEKMTVSQPGSEPGIGTGDPDS